MKRSKPNSARKEAPPPAVLLACRQQGVPPTRFMIIVRIGTQTLQIFERCPPAPFSLPTDARPRWRLRNAYRCSTSRFGVGQAANSFCTPLGLHRVVEKIGGGWPVGAVFRGRRLAGFTWLGLPGAPITNRILWLEGLEPGLNRGGGVDSHARYIYIHGTGDEPGLGRPASHGCIQLAGADLLPLFDRLPAGSLVWIGW